MAAVAEVIEPAGALDPARPDDASTSPRAAAQRDVWMAATVGLAALWVWTFGLLVWRLHARHRTTDYDLGLYDQTIWLLAHGGRWSTIGGSDVLAGHLSPALLAFVPAYWLGFGGPQLLDLVLVVALASSAVIVHALVRDASGRGWLGTVAAGCVLAHPTVQGLVWETFHPEVIAVPFLLGAWLMATRQRWRAFAVCCVLAVLWKEDVALVVAGLGFVLAVRGHRRVGLVTMGAAATWFLAAVVVVLPALAGGDVIYAHHFSRLGGSTGEVLTSIATRPGAVAERLRANHAGSYLVHLVAPYGFVPLIAPLLLLPGAQAGLNLLADYGWIADPELHYAALPWTAVTLAFATGLGRLGRSRRGAVAAAAVVVVASLTALTPWGSGPGSRDYTSGLWPLADDQRQGALDDAVGVVPHDASVSASWNLVPHLSQRSQIWTFPNPWEPVNLARPERRPDPRTIQWLVVDTTTLDAALTARARTLAAQPGARVLIDEQGVLVVRLPSG